MENTREHPRFHEAYSIAIVCYEANRAWCFANADQSQKSWDEAEEWQRESAVKGVLFRMDNPEAGHDAQHNAWMKEKIDQGWVYGEVKDAESKTHPCIVPFDQLPEFQQKKDALFCAIVDALVNKEAKVSGLTFGEAIVAAKGGKKVARAGWNGSGMYAVIMPGYEKSPLPARTAKIMGVPEGTEMAVRPYWALKTAQDDIASWAPSGSDSLADDWVIVD